MIDNYNLKTEKGNATIHSCRNTHATRHLNKGMRLEKVPHLLGHTTATQKYARFATKEIADRAQVMINQSQTGE